MTRQPYHDFKYCNAYMQWTESLIYLLLLPLTQYVTVLF